MGKEKAMEAVDKLFQMWDVQMADKQRHDFEVDHFDTTWDKYTQNKNNKLEVKQRLKFIISLMSLSQEDQLKMKHFKRDHSEEYIQK